MVQDKTPRPPREAADTPADTPQSTPQATPRDAAGPGATPAGRPGKGEMPGDRPEDRPGGQPGQPGAPDETGTPGGMTGEASGATPTGTPDVTERGSDPAPTADQLRKEIDRGHGGDKKGFADPSAAPLGTDDEAAGTPNTAAQRGAAYEEEITGRDPVTPTAPGTRRPMPTDPQMAEPKGRGLWMWLLVALALLAVAALLF
jgi:hypothetical protein